MEKKTQRKYKFYEVLKEKSSKKYYNDIEYLEEWEIYNQLSNNCGHRNHKEEEEETGEEETDEEENKEEYDCINCICGEKCIYRIFYIRNIFNENKLIVGSKCVLNFLKENYKKYKNKKIEIRKEKTRLKNEKIKQDEKNKKEEEKRKQLEEIQKQYIREKALKELQKSRCDDCLSLLDKFNNCYTCKYIKPEHKRNLKKDYFIKWVEGEANKKELTGYIKLLYNFLIKKKENNEYIEELKIRCKGEEENNLSDDNYEEYLEYDIKSGLYDHIFKS